MRKKTIAVYFEADTERLDDLFGSYQQWKTRDYPRAREYFAAFKFGLQRHFAWEEEALFPLFDKKPSVFIRRLIDEMKLQHREILHNVEETERKLKKGQAIEDQGERELLRVLKVHNEKEEKYLYPAIAHAATKKDIDRVFQEIKAMPDEKYFLRDMTAGISVRVH